MTRILYRVEGPLLKPGPPDIPHPADTTTFYLGTHQPHWLATVDVPLFVSHRRLRGRKSFPRARTGWALDSGGFTELSLNGGYADSPRRYVQAIRRYSSEIGLLNWAAVQDWMCEPGVRQVTSLSVEEHQQRTCESYLMLRALWYHTAAWGERPVNLVPVLQGWDLDDYKRHYEMYVTTYRVNLDGLPLVGIGSVCRRGSGATIEQIVEALHWLPLHGFGVKTDGLKRFAWMLSSADSMAWSYAARRKPPLVGCTTHINCANCRIYALRWRLEVLAAIRAGQRRDAGAELYQPPLGLFSDWQPEPHCYHPADGSPGPCYRG